MKKSGHTNRRYLNIWDVEGAIPKVDFLFREMIRLRSRMLGLAKNIGTLGGRLKFDDPPVFSADPAAAALEKRLFDLTGQYASFLREILKLGALTDNIDIGAFDFYSFYEGQEILFCWQYGEDGVRFWHYPGEKFVNRRHLESLFIISEADGSSLH